MPRIAATLGVFGLVVVSLGLNMAQFPIECIAVMPTPESGETEAAGSPTEAARTAPVLPTTASEEPSGDGSEAEGRATAANSTYAGHPTQPAHSTGSDDTDQQPERSPGYKPDEEVREPFSGGIYNPLEPQPASAADGLTFAQAPPEVPAVLTPTEAVPGPPYGIADSAPVTAGRAMVPVDPELAGERGESTREEPVTRLPPVGAAWPAVPANDPLNPASPCPERRYPTTGAAYRSWDATEDASGTAP